jgi:hypothetical protein
MFTIRKEQMAALIKIEVRTIEDRTLDHLRKTFPQKFAALGEEKARELIRYGVKHVAKYGFKGDPDVTKYIEVMVLFGRDFDADPRLPWAGAILRKRKKPAVKISALHEEAVNRWKNSENPAAD